MKAALAILILVGALGAAALPARADEYSFKRTLDTSAPPAGVRSVAVSAFNGNIHLYADDGSTIRVHAVLGARTEEGLTGLDVRTSRDAGTLRVQEVCPASRRFIFWSFRDCDIELEVRYPRALALSLNSENGNIVIDDAGGAVSVKNSNGNIRVNGAGGSVNIRNGNGNVGVAAARQNIDVSNTNGNLTASLLPNWRGSAIAMHTNAGNVALSVPRGFTATVNAKVTLGQVENRANLQKGPVTVTMSANFGNLIISRQ